ncbi:MAG: undecaprenyldiphospho-muramoylpentapeptide beta-N-acetylglucosaminyltransferase [Treponema sp.]|nr:undecaprenyldiphospho-muramoylpentapeptide beta-N-acetylglucosaminyltransferase [Treponema sp.]
MISIAFTGGGTGGHIYPGLAVAEELKKLLGSGFKIFWIGSSAGMDRLIVEEAKIDFFGVPSGKLRRYFSLKNIIDLFKVIGGFIAACRILKKQKACLLFSKGGFVSVPPCAAAAALGIKVFTHESDYSPGLATKINTRFVSRTKGGIFTAYEDTAAFFPEKIRNERITICGNPVRSVFRNADPQKGRDFLKLDKDARILLVLGGSQGAHEVNELVRASLCGLIKTYTVVHQTGPALKWDIEETDRYKPFPYIKEEMPHVMAAAELVMGRSGAGVWEWAVLGKPMLLIPLRGSGTRGDQVENARFFQKAGAAQVLAEGEGAQELLQAVNIIAHNDIEREKMTAASLKIGQSDGAKIIAQVLAENIMNNFGENK